MEIVFSGSIEDNVGRAADIAANELIKRGYTVKAEVCNNWQVRLTVKCISEKRRAELAAAAVKASEGFRSFGAKLARNPMPSPDEKYEAYQKQRAGEPTAMQVALANLKSEQALEDHKKYCSEQLEKVRSQVELFPLRDCQKQAVRALHSMETGKPFAVEVPNADPKQNGGW